MARIIYAIIRADGCWRVICERRRIGRYDTCEQAALAAVALARQASEDNHFSEVLLQDKAGELWPVALFDPAGFCIPIEIALQALAEQERRAEGQAPTASARSAAS